MFEEPSKKEPERRSQKQLKSKNNWTRHGIDTGYARRGKIAEADPSP